MVSDLLELSVMEMEEVVWCREQAVRVSGTAFHKVVKLETTSVSVRSSFTAWEFSSMVDQVPWLLFVSAYPLHQCQ